MTRPGEPARMRAQGLVCGQVAGPTWCEDEVFSRGLCRRHYRRAARGVPLDPDDGRRVGVTRSGYGLWGQVAEVDGRQLCHECGRWYVSLAVHIGMVHSGVRAYRLAHGLTMSVSLIATPLREHLARTASEQHAIARLEPTRSPATLALADPALIARGARLHHAPDGDPDRGDRTPQPEQIPAPSPGRATERAEAHWHQLLAAAGFRDMATAVTWARATGAGWAALARRLGCSQTALRRRGEAAGLYLDRAKSDTTAEHLAAAAAHAARHGDLSSAAGPLATWLKSRRHQRAARAGLPASEVDAALDAIDPGWSTARRAPTQDSADLLAAAAAHAAQHGDLSAATGQLARWLNKRRHLRSTRADLPPTAVERALDAIDPTWSTPRRPRRART